MNRKILPVFILAIAVSISSTAPLAYAEEISDVTVMHETAPRQNSDIDTAIAPNPEPEPYPDPSPNPEPLVISPGPLQAVASVQVSDPNAGIPVVTVVRANTDEPIIGGDRDEHGCLGPAGYAWDQEEQACIRPWSREAQEAPISPAPAAGNQETIGIAGSQESVQASALGPLEGLWQALANAFQALFGWML
jgi:hypothetical protein